MPLVPFGALSALRASLLPMRLAAGAPSRPTEVRTAAHSLFFGNERASIYPYMKALPEEMVNADERHHVPECHPVQSDFAICPLKRSTGFTIENTHAIGLKHGVCAGMESYSNP